jgi:hypothetical protein
MAARLASASDLRARFGELPLPRRWALALGILWVVVVVAYAIGFLGVAAETRGRGTVFLDGLFLLMALVLPLILLWLAAWLAEELARQRQVIAALADASRPLIDALETTQVAIGAAGGLHRAASGGDSDISAGLAALRKGQERLERRLEALASGMAVPDSDTPPPKPPTRRIGDPVIVKPSKRPPVDHGVQPPLPLLPAGEDPPPELPAADLVRALDFPRDEQDFDGFRALQAALRHQPLAHLLQSAEDVLTLMSQEGLYMDDMASGTPDPALWRRFISGARGPDMAPIGGPEDTHAVELAQGLMRSDPIFRDTALFFQRRFLHVLADFADRADDAALRDLAQTRSAKAFGLLSRLSGAFD